MIETTGLEVVHWPNDDSNAWAVVHSKTGIPAVKYLRQRRFAEEAMAEFLATGADFTCDEPAKDKANRELWRDVFYKWRYRTDARVFDNETGELYSALATSYGTFIPSAKWAEAYRAAKALYSTDVDAAYAEITRLQELGNKAVNGKAA